MPLTKRLNPVGNSAGLTIDKPILKQVGWERGDEIELRVEGETIILSRHKYAAPKEVAASAKRMMLGTESRSTKSRVKAAMSNISARHFTI